MWVFFNYFIGLLDRDHLTLDVQAGGSLVGVAHLSLLQVLGKNSLDLSDDLLVQLLGLGQNPSVLVRAASLQVSAVPDDGVVVVVGSQDVVVDGLIGTVVPTHGHEALIRSSGHVGGSVVVQLRVVIVAPTDSQVQLSGLSNLEVVGVVEGGAISVLLQGRLITLQLVPVSGVLYKEVEY